MATAAGGDGDGKIEIVADTNPQTNGVASSAADPIVDVHSAAAYGDLDRLRRFVEAGNQSVSETDGNGYYALQWCALNNHAHIAQYLIQHGGDVNAVDNTGQSALHWAAARGSVAAADVLLQSGARVEAGDVNGYRAVHVAAQYGHTTFLNHMIAKHGADFDAPDKDGRSPLHWAAYKGFADTVRLLLFRDGSQGRQDKEGCTPLHWAALRGNLEVCTILVLTGNKQELTVKDNSGFTPHQLASDKGHRHLAYILSNARKGHACIDKLFGGWLQKNGYAPILWFIIVILMVLFFNSVVFAPNFPKVTAVIGLWSWIAVSLAFASMLMFYRVSSKDPGFIEPRFGKSATHASDSLLGIDLNCSIWTGNWSQLCPTCKIIRPLRSKHCPSCKHCVEQFDHHCPWISNCVGKKNKCEFFVFLCMGTFTMFLGVVIAVHRMWIEFPARSSSETWFHLMVIEHPGAVVFLFIDFILFSGSLVLTVVQASQVARNITTNELANASRYSYLRGPDGRLRNPYNQGCRKNCADFLIHGHSTDEEFVWPSLEQGP